MTTADQVAPLDSAMEPAKEPAMSAPMPVTSRLIGAIAVGAALLSATATFLVLSGLTPIAPVHEVVVKLLLGNALTGLLLLAVIGRDVWAVVRARRRGHAGSRLHVQIVGLFAVIAAVPTVLVSMVASTTLDRGLDRFFSTRTRAMIEQSLIVADAYVSEHAQAIRGEIMAMAFDISRAKPMFDTDRDKFRKFLTAQASARGLSAAIMIRPDGSTVERADLKMDKAIVLPSRELFARITEDEPQVALIPEGDHVAAAVKLHGYDDTYLYVARLLDPRVVQQLRATQESVGEYANLEAHSVGIQIAFALMFTVIALIVLLSSAWIGLDFANRLVAPIRRLIGAANVVSTGNLHIQVPVLRSEGDLAQLGQTFNKMTAELRTQHDDIVRARDVIDSRRRFTEAVLAGASAGVIGVNADGRITILNRSAERLSARAESEALGRPLTEVAPELAEIFQAGAQRQSASRPAPGHGEPQRSGAEFLRARDERTGGRIRARLRHHHRRHHRARLGAALDGVGRHRAAHRPRDQKSADADPIVGRTAAPQIRQGHRRRRRRVRAMHRDDRAPGRRHQAHGRRILALRPHAQGRDRRRGRRRHRAPGRVSDARRPPGHRLRRGVAGGNDAGAVRPAAHFAGAHQHHQERDRSDRRGTAAGRGRLRSSSPRAGRVGRGRGRIAVSARRDGKDVIIDVIDNGIGLPKENRARLLEPYVTTREKGTGLGLAIVGRILEEHGGRIELHDAAEKTPGARGAWMQLRFVTEPLEAAAAPGETRQATV